MKLRNLGANQTEVTVGDKTVLFSYNTPVAYSDGTWTYVTSKKWSVTTSRHINKWISKFAPARYPLDISQEKIDAVLK